MWSGSTPEGKSMGFSQKNQNRVTWNPEISLLGLESQDTKSFIQKNIWAPKFHNIQCLFPLGIYQTSSMHELLGSWKGTYWNLLGVRSNLWAQTEILCPPTCYNSNLSLRISKPSAWSSIPSPALSLDFSFHTQPFEISSHSELLISQTHPCMLLHMESQHLQKWP